MADDPESSMDRPTDDSDTSKPENMFTLKKWNAVAMWSWDVECDICAICRVQVMVKAISEYSRFG
ncbi:RING-box protein 2 isoform X2 [Drosophila persimilis]|uniref:RING-box protein 2 isoform X2 n=1 Tax=Drosophila pseudoobscura pseudoobscura TaxID=46245 RepID=A0A6I8VED1_DROPS|nr:RING-box protein 2 isoform X2 [Drosophila pseudoobscura]XP_026842498.1 RING-box protein 2 isoform X2 [Drosophila persimilis]